MEQNYTWLLEVAVLIIMARVLEAGFARIGLPRIIAYIVLGIAVAGFRYSAGVELTSVTIALANIGIMSLLFLAGLESDLRQFTENMKSVGIVALGGVVGAVATSLLVFTLIGRSFNESLAMGIILSATSISITVKTFEELGALNTLEAQLVIGAAVVDDVIGLALLSLLHGFTVKSTDVIHVVAIPILAFVAWFGTAYLANMLTPRLFSMVSRLGHEASVVSIAFALLLLFAYMGSTMGLSPILLAYALGLGIAGSGYFAQRIRESTWIISSIFTPLFFIYAGSRLEIGELSRELPAELTTIILVVAVALTSKVIGCYVASRAIGLDNIRSLIIGVGMVPRAEVVLTAATLSLGIGAIKQDMFAGTLLSIPITQILTPIVIKSLYTRITPPSQIQTFPTPFPIQKPIQTPSRAKQSPPSKP